MPFHRSVSYDKKTLLSDESFVMKPQKDYSGEEEESDGGKNCLDSWEKHHEHTLKYTDEVKKFEPNSGKSPLGKRGVQQISPDASDIESNNEDNISVQRPIKLAKVADYDKDYSDSEEGKIEIISDDDEESVQDSHSEFRDAVDMQTTQNTGSLESKSIEASDTVSFDVGAVAAIVGGSACAFFYLWRGNKQKAKESMSIFVRGFNTLCEN